MYDLIVRNGTIVDGTGAPRVIGDVAVRDGVIVQVGGFVEGEAREVIDATGLVVTPGFVDHHTHYDGQVTWDDVLEPTSGHGVTTIVVGNCGVGFAPARVDRHQQLIELMEAVEDIPGAALAEGLAWNWETFPEYLDAIEGRRWTMDVATMVTHAAVRVYVMGDRGARNEASTAADIEAMAQIVKDGLAAGAYGFSTSRTLGHTTRDGEPVPGTFASEDELFGIAAAMSDAPDAIFEIASLGAAGEDPEGMRKELDWMRRVSLEFGTKITYLLLQYQSAPDMWKVLLADTAEAIADGARIVAQVASRPFGMLIGFPSYHPFQKRPTFQARRHSTSSLAELAAELRKPEVKAAILAEPDTADSGTHFDMLATSIVHQLANLYPLGAECDYEPTADRSVAALAAAAGRDPLEYVYDLLVDDDAQTLLMLPFFNYAERNHDALLEMMTHPTTVLGLGDGGAHCAMICDASMPTYLLSHWVRDRSRGERLPLEEAVRMQTSEAAALFGLDDRGTLAVGKKADMNVIDLDRIALLPPRAVDDLPAGGRRLLQGATGYVATIVNGEVTRREGVDTGARPGRLLRSTRA
jgi:N-acyl-D-amino-acid deacylase